MKWIFAFLLVWCFVGYYAVLWAGRYYDKKLKNELGYEKYEDYVRDATVVMNLEYGFDTSPLVSVIVTIITWPYLLYNYKNSSKRLKKLILENELTTKGTRS